MDPSWQQNDNDSRPTQQQLYKMIDKLKTMAREVPP